MTTEEEKAVVMKLVEAWELWLTFDDRTSEETETMLRAIHMGQDVIRGRVAKRADPEFWI